MSIDLKAVVDDPARRADVSAVELVEVLLERIAATADQINTYITVTGESAREEAARSDERRERGESLGPLDGMPIAIKDNIDVAGVRCTRGSSFFSDYVPQEDAEVVRRLREAGAVILGKVQLHEFAYGATTNNVHYGPCRNPWDLDRVPGGSSGGSGAALGADLAIAALGSDTGGSVRIPAALNNVSALRPTFGLISVRGTYPIGASLDTVGPMARSITDVAAVTAALAGYDRNDPHAADHPYEDLVARLNEGVAGLRVGLPREFFYEDLEPSIASTAREAAERLASLGAEVVEHDLEGAEEATAIATILIRAEALGLHRDRVAENPGGFDPDVLRRLKLGEAATGADVAEALAFMRAWRVKMLRVFDDVDILLTPTTNATAPLREGGEMVAMTAQLTRLTYAWSLAGLPAASVPAGFDDKGLPIGVQIAAAQWNDATVLRTGQALQSVTDFHLQRPPAFPS